MGGAFTIRNKIAITLKVMLKSHGLWGRTNHCQDVILAGERHDYGLAKFCYDIIVEGGDGAITHDAVGKDPRTANNVIATDGATRKKVLPLKLAGLDASKAGGSTTELYILEV
jgi:hypothetical protein